MSDPHLPTDILDHIVDLLHNDTLRNCCLVSKSWIPRTRKHLFAKISFRTAESLQSWKKTFPDPSTSPAYYAKTLSISCLPVAVVADAESGGWITGFSRVVHLEVADHHMEHVDQLATSLVLFHGFSPTIKSLRVTLTVPMESSHIFSLILSFPLLEDLIVTTRYNASTDNGDGSDRLSTIVQPSDPPAFTGCLDLYLVEGMAPIARRLLSLPGGLHFWKLTLKMFCGEDVLLTMALVEKCSHTLEFLEVSCGLLGTFIQHLRPHQ